MEIWFGRYTTTPFRLFCSGRLPTPQCYHWSLNFLGSDHISPGVLGQGNYPTHWMEFSHWLFHHLISCIYLVEVPGVKRSGVRGTTLAGPLCGLLRSTKTGSGRLRGCELPKMRMDPFLRVVLVAITNKPTKQVYLLLM